MPPPEAPVLLLTTWSDTEAEVVRQLLGAYGIECAVSSDVPHSLFPLSVDGLGAIRLHVPASAEGEARRILEAHRGAAEAGEAGGGGSVVPMPVTVRAPTRIDLAGGTLDIWPVYLFLDGPVTVNLAIDQCAEVEARVLSGERVALASQDLEAEVEAESLARLEAPPALQLAARLVRHFAPRGGVRLKSAAAVPAGSGLGGSSAVAVAGAIALARLAGERLRVGDAERLARLLANLEAQVLGIPTGVQDYYPALLGGCLALAFGPAGVVVERLPVDLGALEDRLVLAYEGVSRSSGISNLDMLLRFLQGESTAREGLARVAAAARAMAACLGRGDLDGAGRAMAEEMSARATLSPKVMTGMTERLFVAARGAGALAAKVCGAGGGGCSVYWCRAGERRRVAEAVAAAGGSILEFHALSAGALRGDPPA